MILLSLLTALAVNVELLDAGSGEKSPLRVQPKANTTEQFQMVLDMDMAMDMGGTENGPAPKQDLPPLQLTMKANITQVEANGDVHYTYTVTDAKMLGDKIDPMIKAALDQQLPTMVGTGGSLVVSNQGVIKKSEIKVPEGADPTQLTNVQKGMSHANAPFPSEAVGTGAKWKVVSEVQDNGLNLKQTVTYTLAERKGNKVVLKTELGQTPATNDPTLAGGQAKLAMFQSVGTGTTTLDLTRVFPTAGSVKHYLNSVIAMKQAGQDLEVGVEMDLKLDMKRL